MAGRQSVDRVFHVFVDISTVHSAFDQRRSFASLTRKQRRLTLDLRLGERDQLIRKLGLGFLQGREN